MRSARVRTRFSDLLAPLAAASLRERCATGSVFPHAVKLDGSGALRWIGESYRYTAMALVGVAMQARVHGSVPKEMASLQCAMFQWALERAQLGDAALVLWGLALTQDPNADILLRSIERRWAAKSQGHGEMGSASLGWLLAGLSAICRHSGLRANASALGDQIVERLMANRNEKTRLFCLGVAPSRRNIWRRRINQRLGSFASQVYPTVGLAYYAAATGKRQPLEVAMQTADRLCSLQGGEGQWWWIYNVRSGQPVIRYPVYSVHQDGMGPMALLAVMLAGAERDYTHAINKSLDWLEKRRELPEERLVDPERGVVWRAIQRDAPDRTAGFGLGASERLRMGLAAWTAWPDRRAFRKGYVCGECRPYHLGWILAADAMAAALEH